MGIGVRPRRRLTGWAIDDDDIVGKKDSDILQRVQAPLDGAAGAEWRVRSGGCGAPRDGGDRLAAASKGTQPRALGYRSCVETAAPQSCTSRTLGPRLTHANRTRQEESR